MHARSLNIAAMPDQYLPDMATLPFGLRALAEALETETPGKGVRLALALGQALGGQALYVPRVEQFIRPWRNDLIRQRFDQGASAGTCAREFGLSISSVFGILGQAEGSETQLPLFNEGETRRKA